MFEFHGLTPKVRHAPGRMPIVLIEIDDVEANSGSVIAAWKHVDVLGRGVHRDRADDRR